MKILLYTSLYIDTSLLASPISTGITYVKNVFIDIKTFFIKLFKKFLNLFKGVGKGSDGSTIKVLQKAPRITIISDKPTTVPTSTPATTTTASATTSTATTPVVTPVKIIDEGRKYAEAKLKEIEQAMKKKTTAPIVRTASDKDPGRWPPVMEAVATTPTPTAPAAPSKRSVSSLSDEELKGKR